MNLNAKYNFKVLWSEEDKDFIGICPELLGLSWLAKPYLDALEGIIKLVVEELTVFRKQVNQPDLNKTSTRFNIINHFN